HLRPDRRRERDLQRLDRGLQQPDQGPEPRHRLDDVGADLRDDRDHRVHLRQVVRRSGTGLRRREAMTMSAAIATPKTKAIWWGVNILVLLYAFIPVIWIVSLSLKPDAVLNDGRFFPSQLTGEHYEAIFQNNDFTRALINSIGICLISTFIAIIVGTMAAYAVARLDFPGKKFVVGASLMIAMFPQIALVTPLFKILTGIGLFDTWLGLIIPYITFALPLAIYTLSAFFREIPWELEKAAKMDGATPYQAFRKVIAPLAMPG